MFTLDRDGNLLVTTPSGVTRIRRPPGSYLLEPYEFGEPLPDAVLIEGVHVAKGSLVRVHPALDRPRTANNAPASASTPASAAPVDSGFDDGGGFDAFGADDSTSAFAAAMAAEPEAPAQAPAKEQAKPTGRTTSFQSGPRRA